MMYNTMTNKEISTKIRELGDELEKIMMIDEFEKWDETYNEYMRLSAILDERYREENQADFDAYYEKYIKGRKWEEIDPDAWSFYSDWHKDMYGYRPKRI